jgi:hypothetical protein
MATTDGKARRRFARREVNLLASVRIHGGELRAVAENISPGGAFLRVELPETVDVLEADIQLPHGRDLHVRATVRWRSRDPRGVGIQFERFLEPAQLKE